jgi:hypothetical protein
VFPSPKINVKKFLMRWCAAPDSIQARATALAILPCHNGILTTPLVACPKVWLHCLYKFNENKIFFRIGRRDTLNDNTKNMTLLMHVITKIHTNLIAIEKVGGLAVYCGEVGMT